MKAHRLIIMFVAVASVAALIGAGAAATNGTPDWLDALNARSAALNKQYGLGDDAGRRRSEPLARIGCRRSRPEATR